jgi:membrane fusion protein (multidrug efflux system)
MDDFEDNTGIKANAKPKKKPSAALLKIVIVLALFAVGGFYYSWMHKGQESTDDATFEASVVTISPKIGGYIKTLNIRDNQLVKAGDVLLEIDPSDYIIRVTKAEAALQAAEASLASSGQTLETVKIQAPSGTDAARAQVELAQADFDNAVTTRKRLQSLSDQARSKQQLDDAIANEKRTLSALNDAKAKFRSAATAPQSVGAAQANTEQLAAVAQQAQADLAQAKKDLADTKIVATIDGRIANRGVEQGDYVQAGQALFYLVGNDPWVVANFKETQLNAMRSGQVVDIEVDAYPDLELKGKVESVQAGTGARFSAFPAQNATGNFVKIVQRVPVKIVIDQPIDPHYIIGPGMSVIPTVHTQ